MEYFKYKAQSDFVDTGKLTQDVISAVTGIGERKAKKSAELQSDRKSVV